jgi:hypothetical protein
VDKMLMGKVSEKKKPQTRRIMERNEKNEIQIKARADSPIYYML